MAVDPNALFQNNTPSPIETLPSPVEEVTPVSAQPNFNRLAAIANVNTNQPHDDILSQYHDLVGQMTASTDAGREEDIRLSTASRQQTQQLQSLSDYYRITQRATPEDTTTINGIVGATNRVIAEGAQTRKNYAVEQEAIKNIQAVAASGDTTQATLLLNNLQQGDADQVIRDTQTKRMILQRAVNSMQESVDGEGWVGSALDTIMGTLTLPSVRGVGEIGNVEISNHLKSWLDLLASGKRGQVEADSLWSMPVEDFHDYVNNHLLPAVRKNSTFLGFTDKSQELSVLKNFLQTDSNSPQQILDNLGLAATMAPVEKVLSIPSLLVRNGARKEAGELVASSLAAMQGAGGKAAEDLTGLSEQETIQNVVPTGMLPQSTLQASKVSVGADAMAALDRGRALAAELPEVLPTSRFVNKLEYNQALKVAQDRISAEYGNNLKDVQFSTEALSDNSEITHSTLTLGKKASGGYASERSARTAMSRLGFDTADIIQDESGQYFGTIKLQVPETGLYTNLLNAQEKGLIPRYLYSARRIVDSFTADTAQAAGNAKNRVLKGFASTYEKALNGVTDEEKLRLGQVIMKGQNTQQWFSQDDLNELWNRAFKEDPSQRVHDAYNAYKHVNDTEFALRNDQLYKEKSLRGFQSVSFDTGQGSVERKNALINRSMNNVSPVERTYDIGTGTHYHGGNPLTRSVIERKLSEGYVSVKLETPLKLSDGTEIKTFLAKPKDLSIEALRADQLGYSEGGHRFYTGKYFAKQTVVGHQPDTGEAFLRNPNTYINGRTKGEVDEWTSKMEQARLQYKADPDASKIDEILGGPGYPSGDEFIKGMRDGTYEPEHKFQTLYDRELPEEYLNSGKDFIGDTDESGFGGWLRTNGRMYYSPKGEQLTDFRGALAPTLDPWATINKALTNVANLSTFSDYKISNVQRWLDTFGKYLDKGGLPEDASPYTLFSHAGFTDQRFPGWNKIKQEALAQREVIQRNIGWRGEGSIQSEQAVRNMAEFVMGNATSETIRGKIGAGLENWVTEKSPISSLRGMAFDAKLGLFNIAQMPLQMATMAASLSLSPKAGLKGMLSLIPLRAYLTKAGSDAMLDTFIARGSHVAAGFADAADFKAFMKTSKLSGFFDFGGSHLMINDQGTNVAYNSLGVKAHALREASRFFFNEPEVWNRAVAMRIAWEEAKEKFGKVTSPEALRFLQGRAEDYAFGMSAQSAAYWQKGILSIPTQFWAYNARNMEALLGKQFTTAQKIRLAVSQSILYGSAGFPAVSLISELIKGHNGQSPDLNSFWGAADRGFIDEMVHLTTGADVLIGKRAGTGNWVTDVIRDFAGMGEYGAKSPAVFLGGATAGILGTTIAQLTDIAKYFALESGGDPGEDGMPLTTEGFRELFANISTVNNAMKAYLAFKYQTYITSKGTVLAKDLPTADAFFIGLGFQPGQQDQISSMMEFMQNKSKNVDDAAKIVLNYRSQYQTEPDKSDQIGKQINLFMSLLPPDVRIAVLKKVNKNTQSTFYDNLALRVQREKALQDMEDNQSGPTN